MARGFLDGLITTLTREAIRAGAVVIEAEKRTWEQKGRFDDAISAYERGDYTMALQLFHLLADQGIAESQFNLGLMYANGQHINLAR